MRKLLAGLGMAAAMLISVGPSALAATPNGDLVFTNATSTTFTDVYICKSNAEDWGSPVFSGPVGPGQTTKAVFTGFGEGVCKFSIRVIDSDGTKWDVDEIDMCDTDKVTFKKEGGKMKYYAE